jgi:hypothetical protein
MNQLKNRFLKMSFLFAMNIILCFLPKINYRYYENTSAYLTKYSRLNKKVSSNNTWSMSLNTI